MNITYNHYPSLLFVSYNKDNAPDELPFEVLNTDVRQYLSTCKGFNELFSYIAVKNSHEKNNTHTHFYLSDATFNQVDSNTSFRNENFSSFFSSYIKPIHGTILFKNGGQYVYLLLSKQDTKNLKGADGRYIATALFKNNFFIGFEEAIITEKGLKVLETGHYSNGMDVGGYLSFCIITLAFAHNKPLSKAENNNTTEVIFKL